MYNVINLIGQLNITLENVISITAHTSAYVPLSKLQGENTCQPKYPN